MSDTIYYFIYSNKERKIKEQVCKNYKPAKIKMGVKWKEVTATIPESNLDNYKFTDKIILAKGTKAEYSYQKGRER